MLVHERHEHQLQEPGEPGGLRGDREERGHGDRRSLVGVGCPELEGHRAHLEREPHDHEQDRRVGEGPLRAGEPAETRGHLVEPRGPREPDDHAHPVEHHGRGQDADDEELEPALVALHVALAERCHQEPGGRDELERDEQHQQVTRRGHQHAPEERREQQEVVLALVEPALTEVAQRDGQHRDGGTQEEHLEEHRERVHDVVAAERRALLADQRERRDQRGDHAQEADRHRAPGAPPGQEGVDHEHDDHGPGQDQGREDRVVVDAARHPLSPRRARSGSARPRRSSRTRAGGTARARG